VTGVPDYLPSTSTSAGSMGGVSGGRRLSTPGKPAERPMTRLDRGACRSRAGAATAVGEVVGEVEAAVLGGFLAELAVVDLTRPRVLARLRSAAHEAGVLACREMAGAPIPQASCSTPARRRRRGTPIWCSPGRSPPRRSLAVRPR
jgi:hypothetical protein